jgi:hypothetical protein
LSNSPGTPQGEKSGPVPSRPAWTAPPRGLTRGASGGDGTHDSVNDVRGGWQHILVRAAEEDWDLMYFDARYDTAQYPAEWLWGPGTVEDASAWLDREQPSEDEVDVLDRLFLLRFHNDLLYLPRNPDQAASVAEDEKPGTWYVVRADSPLQAFNHQRQVLAGGFGCARSGDCRCCPVQTIGSDTWQQVMILVASLGVNARKINVPDTRVPPRMGWPRCNRIMNGGWEIPEGERP